MKPTISIIVPVYNVEAHLRACLDSILAQTFSNFEVLLINDGSTDNSGMICDEYSERDDRVKVIHKNNGGVSSARNAGTKSACGDFIAFVDGDDWLDPDIYSKLYQLCIETNSDISICRLGRQINGQLTHPKEQNEYLQEMDNVEALRQLFRGVLYRFSLCNKLFKKSCFQNILFPEGRIHEDLSTTYKLFANSTKAVYTNYVGYIYVKRENSILTKRFNEKRLDAFIGWEEILTFMNKRYPQLSQEVTNCFAYSCVDNVFYTLNQIVSKKEKVKYLSIIQCCVGKYYQCVMINPSLAIRYKVIIVLLVKNVEVLIFLHWIKDLIRKPKINS